MKMKLDNEPFNLIKDGNKTIEVRLNDKKRESLKIGNIIEFTNIKTDENLQVEIVALLHHKTFEELLRSRDMHAFGDNNKGLYLEYLRKIYSKKEEKEYGVLGIKIKVIKQ